MGGQRHAAAVLYPGKTRYPLCRKLSGPQDRSGRVWKISPSPEFDPRTVQPVASSYTDWAIPALKSLDTLEVIDVECQVTFPPLSRKVFMEVKDLVVVVLTLENQAFLGRMRQTSVLVYFASK
jgi:hypothetical protein